jgi:hypothetical protein
VDQPKAPAYHPGISEHPFDSGGAGFADNVKILGFFPKHQVPDRSPHYVGRKALGAEPLGDMHRVTVNISEVNPVFFLGINNSLFNGFAVFFRPVSDKQRTLFKSQDEGCRTRVHIQVDDLNYIEKNDSCLGFTSGLQEHRKKITAKARKAHKGGKAARLPSCFAGFPFYNSEFHHKTNKSTMDVSSVAFSLLPLRALFAFAVKFLPLFAVSLLRQAGF